MRHPGSPVPALSRWLALGAVVLAAIVVPFLLFGDRVEAWVRTLLARPEASWRTAAVLAGLLATDVLLPIPSSLVSTACGGVFGVVVGTAVSWIGMTGGALLGYGLGARIGRRAVLRWAGARAAAQGARVLARHGTWGLVLCRGVPVLAEASVLLAGASPVPLARVAPALALSNLGLSLAYAAAGAAALEHRSVLLAFAGAIGVPAVAALVARAWSRVPLGARP